MIGNRKETIKTIIWSLIFAICFWGGFILNEFSTPKPTHNELSFEAFQQYTDTEHFEMVTTLYDALSELLKDYEKCQESLKGKGTWL